MTPQPNCRDYRSREAHAALLSLPHTQMLRVDRAEACLKPPLFRSAEIPDDSYVLVSKAVRFSALDKAAAKSIRILAPDRSNQHFVQNVLQIILLVLYILDLLRT